ncbi:Glycosyl transferase family 3 N-terminal domain superfamily [Arabidopsis thaliana x Arabidopsis arenosa]|uniref:Glycosyl transferase family 3 N-terminal domain superfamily n=1 Tax=Arabidopsis thaliana x Arabidopsis arenosa TaxID=1240361 RepID=A0A8T2BM28_9BRAS|nr:Glycosyl transferase family 3 N-terminal domain superfamily [Arabidopsis thaliana x Arabidopsis arenosa]
MKALLNPESFFCLSSISSSQIKRSLHFNGLSSSSCLRFALTDFGGRTLQRKLTGGLSIKAVLDSAMMEQLGLKESDVKNPALSSTYRGSEIPKPNLTVLDAQARVCTGPTQTRPLSEEQAFKVFDTILRSARGELKDEEPVSKAQLGAFFAGMTIRANAFPEETQWSEGEKRAMDVFWPLLVRALPPDVLFIADPEGSLLGTGNSVGPTFVGNESREMRLVGALREILAGGHLGYEEVKGVLRDVLPLATEGSLNSGVSESLLSAFLIGQRMNRETDRELKAYCLAFDDEHGAPPIADVKSLTHYGEPYDGNTRFFRSTLFVATVRSCYGESSLLHGVEWMPPKGGVTEEQMLKFMGANTHLSVQQAKELIEDEKAGFAYLSLREARPSLYSLIGMREHIKKRPPLATTEKVQQFVRATGKEAIVAGFYHEGYEEPLLMLMRRRGVHSGLVVKGEEGALSMTTRVRAASASKGFPVNYCSGFRSLSSDTALEADGVSRQSFNLEVDARNYGFEPTETPRTDRSVSKNIELGLAALRGEKGAAYDRIVLNAGIVDHLLGGEGAEDVAVAMERAKEAIDSGKALKKLLNYIEISRKMK